MAHIFINYRREGGAYAAALLDELLSRRFGEARVFRAAKSITAGSDYEKSLLEAVRGCGVMLVIVDDGWLGRFDSDNGDSDNGESSPSSDWVLREIEGALRYERTVIPVLLSGVDRLREDDLPNPLKGLAVLQYLRFDYRNVRQDSVYLAEQLVRAYPAIAARRAPRPRRFVRFWRALSGVTGTGGGSADAHARDR